MEQIHDRRPRAEIVVSLARGRGHRRRRHAAAADHGPPARPRGRGRVPDEARGHDSRAHLVADLPRVAAIVQRIAADVDELARARRVADLGAAAALPDGLELL